MATNDWKVNYPNAQKIASPNYTIGRSTSITVNNNANTRTKISIQSLSLPILRVLSYTEQLAVERLNGFLIRRVKSLLTMSLDKTERLHRWYMSRIQLGMPVLSQRIRS